jgi:pimeloyl-ACP methyl ester carboxylesterase
MIDRRQIYFPVQAPADATWPTWYLAAWLTVPNHVRRPWLQILLHGAGYDHRYWDWPAEPERHSYVTWAVDNGIATLNVDRVGSGTSSHPPGRENNVFAQADVLHQIIDSARCGLDTAPQFSQIVTIGHSLGSLIAGLEAAEHGNVDAAVLTGYFPLDGRASRTDEVVEAAFMPAVEALPALHGLVDDDYRAARSRDIMLFKSDASREVLAMDDLIKGTTTRGELRDTRATGSSIRASQVPTLVVAGQHDPLLVDRRVDQDAHDTARRAAEACSEQFDFVVVDAAGHNLNLQRNCHDFYEQMNEWLGARLEG